MKKIFNYISLATLMLSAVACSQEDLTSSYLYDSNAVHISAQIGSNNATGGFLTRSFPLGTIEEQAKFKSGDKISVTADEQESVTYTLDDNGTWTPEANKYLKWKSDKMTFAAYYPAGSDKVSASTFTVPQEYTSLKDLENADYMTYVGTRDKVSGNGVILPMTRKMARMVINTIFRNQYDKNNYEITLLTVYSKKAYNGEEKTGEKWLPSYHHTDDKFYALIIPSDENANQVFSAIEVKNKQTNESNDHLVYGVPKTIAGYSYEVNLTIGKDKADITSVKVSDWNTGDIIADTNADEIQKEEIDATNHILTIYDERQFTTENITSALASGTKLTIKGPIGEAGFSTLNKYLSSLTEGTQVDIDLSEAQVTTIPVDAFKNNKKIRKIWLPTETSSIQLTAFKNCTNCTIENIDKLSKLKTIGIEAFYNCKFASESITLPSSVESIGRSAFAYITNLSSIEIPSNITSISSYCFIYCSSLKKIECKGNITSIDDQPFLNCTQLTEIDLTSCTSVPSLYNPKYQYFDNIQNMKVYVPSSLLEAFKADNNWKTAGFKENNFEVKQ